jgi:hypothetical protein
MASPPCSVLTNVPAPTAKLTCKINVGAYQAYYWPQPRPSDPNSFLCPGNSTGTLITRTIPDRPNTVILSGYTLTSPRIYHFLNSITVPTYLGIAVQPGGLGGLTPPSTPPMAPLPPRSPSPNPLPPSFSPRIVSRHKSKLLHSILLP